MRLCHGALTKLPLDLFGPWRSLEADRPIVVTTGSPNDSSGNLVDDLAEVPRLADLAAFSRRLAMRNQCGGGFEHAQAHRTTIPMNVKSC